MISKSIEETEYLASTFSGHLVAGDILSLIGPLGSGKTTFVQGLARGLDINAPQCVRSPTFVLINEYLGGRLPLYHLDFYRLDDSDELRDLGLEEYFDGKGVTVVEWADRFPKALPERAAKIRFKILDESTREIVLPEGV